MSGCPSTSVLSHRYIFSRRVSCFLIRIALVYLHHLGEVNISSPQAVRNGIPIRRKPIRIDLKTLLVLCSPCDFIGKGDRIGCGPVTKMPSKNQFGIPFHSDKTPCIPSLLINISFRLFALWCVFSSPHTPKSHHRPLL